MSTFLPGVSLVVLLVGVGLLIQLVRSGRDTLGTAYYATLLVLVLTGVWNEAAGVINDLAGLAPELPIVQLAGAGLYWPPLLYLYVNRKANIKDAAALRKLWHMLPPIAFNSGLAFLPAALVPAQLGIIYLGVFGAYSFAYLALVWMQLAQFDRAAKQHYSNLEGVNYDWLRFLAIVFTAVIALDVLMSMLAELGAVALGSVAEAMRLLEALVVLSIGVVSLRQPEPNLPRTSDPEPDAIARYSNSPLDTALCEQVATDLSRFFDHDEAYSDDGLSLRTLASRIGVSTHILSQVINQHLGSSFYDYVNQKRIARAKARIDEGAYSSLTQLGFDCGFNNRVSFTKAFKKNLDMTPSAYAAAANSCRQGSDTQSG